MLKNTIAKTLLQLILLPATFCMAQNGYTTAYTGSSQDITNYAITGTNAWVYMGGTPVCQQNTLVVGAQDGSIFCKSPDGYQYQFNPVTKAWVKETAMGTGIISLAVQSVSNVFALKSVGHCGVYGGTQFYGVFHWSGSAWTEPSSTACVVQLAPASDQFLAAIGWDSTVKALYQSLDNGATWQLWSDSWKFVNMFTSENGCAINSGNQLYSVGVGNSAGALPAIPSGTVAGCVALYGDPEYVAWNTAGAAYLLGSTLTWQPIAGLVAKQLAGIGKGLMFGMDSTGKPYHWNVTNAPSITWTMTGNWENFPGMNPSQLPQHTLKLQVAYPHHIPGGGTLNTQVIPYNANANLVASDTNPLCDLIFGPTASAECAAVSGGSEDCSEVGHLGNPPSLPANSGPYDSIDVRGFGQWLDTGGPTLNGTSTDGMWFGDVIIRTVDACPSGIPTCEMPQNIDEIWEDVFHDSTGYLGKVAKNKVTWGMNKSATGQTAPWLYTSEYWILPDGRYACQGGYTTRMWGEELLPPCQ